MAVARRHKKLIKLSQTVAHAPRRPSGRLPATKLAQAYPVRYTKKAVRNHRSCLLQASMHQAKNISTRRRPAKNKKIIFIRKQNRLPSQAAADTSLHLELNPAKQNEGQRKTRKRPKKEVSRQFRSTLFSLTRKQHTHNSFSRPASDPQTRLFPTRQHAFSQPASTPLPNSQARLFISRKHASS